MTTAADQEDLLKGRTRRESFSSSTASPRQHAAWYSSFVRAMKLVLPAIALILVGLIVAWPNLDVPDSKFRIGFANMTVTESEDPSMVNPRYLGTDEDDQPYSVTAEVARRLTDNASVIELDSPKADILLSDQTWLVLSAERGIYGRQAESLDLVGSVVLYHDSGYEFLTETAKIDLNAGAAIGSKPIRGQGPFGNLQAEGFRLENKGKTIFFTGRSKLVIYPGSGADIR